MRLVQYILSVMLVLSVTFTAIGYHIPLLVAYTFGWLHFQTWHLVLMLPIVSLLLPLFADSDGYLPNWLLWFQTRDNPIWGDKQYGEHQGAGAGWYWRSVMWLCRNPAQGLDSALGAWYPLDERPVVKGNPAISDVGGVAGWCLITLAGYFHLIGIVPVGFGRCLHIEAGWRLQQIAQDYASGMANPMTRQLVITCRLFRFGNQ